LRDIAGLKKLLGKADHYICCLGGDDPGGEGIIRATRFWCMEKKDKIVKLTFPPHERPR